MKPGEIIGIDVLELTKGRTIVLAIDYSSRYLFGKLIKNKSNKNITTFLEEVYKEIKFVKLRSDNGKEFDNKFVKAWCKTRNIKQEFSIPYHHSSNGRIERVNRTIRANLKKTDGKLKEKLPKIISSYNNHHHRAIGMTPTEGRISENNATVIENSNKYADEFKKRESEKFMVGDSVYIRNEFLKTKMDKEFKQEGKITKQVSGNVYKVLSSNGKEKLRHSILIKKM